MSETPKPAADEAPGGNRLELSTAVFDVDARRTAYRPLVVRFRGQDYTFGASALGVLTALTIDGVALDQKDGETKAQFGARLLAGLPAVVAALCPSFPAPPWDLDEELALFQAVTEVLQRVAQLRFPSQA